MVVAFVVANQSGHHSSKPNANNIKVDSIDAMLKGIPQNGIELGNPNAKVTLVEFSDPQCPYCGDWARSVFPSLVQKYVRAGTLRVEYRGIAFLGTDSTRLLGLARAAGLQNKLWNVVELEFENQGSENSGYATDAFLKGLVNAVPGLDAEKALSASNAKTMTKTIEAALTLAKQKLKEITTPTFLLGPTGSNKTTTIVGDQPLQTFVDAIDAQLKK